MTADDVQKNSERQLSVDQMADLKAEKTPPTARDMTKGQIAVDVNFNVGQRKDIQAIKQIMADAWDAVDTEVTLKITTNPDVVSAEFNANIRRLEALAKTSIEQASMWAVKAVTR